jgi:hypothetical protein
MKKILLTLVLCCAFAALIYAQHNEVSYSKENNTLTLKVTNSSEKLSIAIKGDVKLGDDDKSILGLSRGGSLYYRKKDQSLEVKNDDKGNLAYTSMASRKQL